MASNEDSSFNEKFLLSNPMENKALNNVESCALCEHSLPNCVCVTQNVTNGSSNVLGELFVNKHGWLCFSLSNADFRSVARSCRMLNSN